jgi:hypothetical protein
VRTLSCVDETGPIVATIFVLRRTAAMPPRVLILRTDDGKSSAATTTRRIAERTLAS